MPVINQRDKQMNQRKRKEEKREDNKRRELNRVELLVEDAHQWVSVVSKGKRTK